MYEFFKYWKKIEKKRQPKGVAFLTLLEHKVLDSQKLRVN